MQLKLFGLKTFNTINPVGFEVIHKDLGDIIKLMQSRHKCLVTGYVIQVCPSPGNGLEIDNNFKETLSELV